jgi:hypothetical protein
MPVNPTNTRISRTTARIIRMYAVVLVGLASLLSTTIVFAQVSKDYDIACRSWLTATGGTISNGSYSLSGALGVPIAPPRDSELTPTYSVRSPSHGLRGGFLPGYPTGLHKPNVKLEPPAQGNFVQRLPIIYKVMFVVRFGC